MSRRRRSALDVIPQAPHYDRDALRHAAEYSRTFLADEIEHQTLQAVRCRARTPMEAEVLKQWRAGEVRRLRVEWRLDEPDELVAARAMFEGV